MSDKLSLKFDPNTIEHLGISLYSKLPSVLSELISNSWDADSDKVEIIFADRDARKEIEYVDYGDGMTFSELNEKYLVIGRNRRIHENKETSASGRKVIGKKGLGKLSVFGVCDVIEVISIKNGFKNHFRMNLDDIKKSSGNYSPELIIPKDTIAETNERGTKILLKQIRRKSGFDLDNIAISLSKKFLIFDKMSVTLSSTEGQRVDVVNELKFNGLNVQFKWNFPDSKYGEHYEYWKRFSGSVFTTETPIKDTEMSGVYLTSRGKIVNNASFYGLRDNDNFHTYVTGYLEIDFIDEFSEDVISTDRHSLIWENDKTKELQNYLQHIIKKIGSEWRLLRGTLKKDQIKIKKGIDVDQWQNSLPTYEKELSNKIITPILENQNIDVDESSQIIGNVVDKFDNKIFKDYASRIADISNSEEIPTLLKLMEEWKIVEAKQYRGIALSRVEVIKQFEQYIKTDTKEVPTLHNFLKQFSWLLDPRILEFKDEVHYSNLLKVNFPEEKLTEANRRIDFLCSNALGEILYVIEIKRSLYSVDESALEQANRYKVFLENHFSSQSGFSRVICYVIGGKKSNDPYFKSKEATYIKSGEVFVKTYAELLEQSKQNHKEFIELYNKSVI
ncbi:ATP-binding protein [Sediminibacterium sp.]|uniref:ATP-binding protein n=1 Tax=Sediminibacterium sp. TaxID=1917865 RepID=UPI0026014041|nr:ATP-binding protein [Sediminibacterium sp.]MBW0176670.1 ATP-binding protein [Sediminibacterium sp.]